jgi:hypothetical protein
MIRVIGVKAILYLLLSHNQLPKVLVYTIQTKPIVSSSSPAHHPVFTENQALGLIWESHPRTLLFFASTSLSPLHLVEIPCLTISRAAWHIPSKSNCQIPSLPSGLLFINRPGHSHVHPSSPISCPCRKAFNIYSSGKKQG